MDQQDWKRDLDEEAKHKKDGEDDDGEHGKPASRGRPRKPRQRRAKGKAKSQKKPKEKKPNEKKPKEKKLKEKKQQDKSGASKEASVPVEKPARRRRGAKQVESDLVVTPSPKAIKVDEELSVPKHVAGDGVLGKKVKKTFAGRYRPSTSDGAALWDSLKAAFTSTAARHVTSPSTKEAGSFRHSQVLKTRLNMT